MEESKIYANAYLDEIFSSELYSKLSKMVKGDLSSGLEELSEMEASHAMFWRRVLEDLGLRTDELKISRVKMLFFLLGARIFGISLMIKLLESGGASAISLYSKILKEGMLPDDKNVELKSVLEDELLHESLFQEESRKFSEFLNHVRDSVLGMSDGLVGFFR